MRKPTTEYRSWIVITEITIVPEMAEMKNTKYGFSASRFTSRAIRLGRLSSTPSSLT